MQKEIFSCHEKRTLLQIKTFLLLFLFSQQLWVRSTKVMFAFPEFTCSSRLTQGRAGGSDPWRFCRNRAHHSGWADMVPPSRYKVPEVTGASHLMWSNKHQLWERGGSRMCRVKGRALCFLRREDTWVCLIAGEKVPFEKQTGAHKRNNWLEQDFWGGGRVPRVQKRFGFRWSRKCVSKALGRRRHLQISSWPSQRLGGQEKKFQIQVGIGSNPRSPLLSWYTWAPFLYPKK